MMSPAALRAVGQGARASPPAVSEGAMSATRCRTGCEGESASYVQGDDELKGPSYRIVQRDMATLYTAREGG